MARAFDRPRRPFWIAAACLAVVLAAVGWISYTVVSLDRSQRAMRQQAMIEENVRLALWRLDSAVAPILAREGIRPVAGYGRSFAAAGFVKLHFQLDQSDGAGRWSSPQGNDPVLGELRQRLDNESLAGLLASRGVAAVADGVTGADHIAVVDGRGTPAAALARQQSKSSVEWVKRSQSVANAYLQNAARAPSLDRNVSDGYLAPSHGLDSDGDGVADNGVDRGAVNGTVASARDRGAGSELRHAMTALWIDGELFLVRRVTYSGGELVQGCWVDWTALRSWLLSSIADLLPGAALEPSTLR